MVKAPPFDARDMGLIPGQGTKILCATWHSWREKKKKKKLCFEQDQMFSLQQENCDFGEWEVPSTHGFL